MTAAKSSLYDLLLMSYILLLLLMQLLALGAVRTCRFHEYLNTSYYLFSICKNLHTGDIKRKNNSLLSWAVGSAARRRRRPAALARRRRLRSPALRCRSLSPDLKFEIQKCVDSGLLILNFV